MAPSVCTSCGSTNLEDDPNAGNTVCTDCGLVVAENAIVSEVGFQETGAGGHSIIGHFVGNDQAHKANLGGLQTLVGKESREVTLQAGKTRLQAVASQLRINQHCVDMAFSFFKMAVARGMTKGRRAIHVTAACLYITCRTEGTAHMLLDFSDVCQVNVYELGRCVNFLSRSLYIHLPVMDPCIYVIRFAHGLKFADKEPAVCKMACRLVKRMKLDWMAIGRRPSGICGAALLLAARYYNFNRTLADIVRVVNIGEAVIRKRLDEFSKTPSSALTLDEFPEVDLEQCDDPPAFKEAKHKSVLEAEERLADELQQDLIKTRAELEPLLSTPKKAKYADSSRCTSPCSVASAASALACVDGDDNMTIDDEVHAAHMIIQDQIIKEALSHVMPGSSTQLTNEPTPAMKLHALRPTLESLGIKPIDPINLKREFSSVGNEDKQNEELDLEGICDDEIDSYILTERESKVKSRMWYMVNGTFMKEMEERRRLLDEQTEKEKNDPNKKKSRPRVKKKNVPAATAHEAMEKIIQERKLSSKINYDVLMLLKPEPKATPDADRSSPKPSDAEEKKLEESFKSPAPRNFAKLKRPARPKRITQEQLEKQEKAAAFGRKRLNKPNLGMKGPKMVMSQDLTLRIS